MPERLEDDEGAEGVPDERDGARPEDALGEERAEDFAGLDGERFGLYPGVV